MKSIFGMQFEVTSPLHYGYLVLPVLEKFDVLSSALGRAGVAGRDRKVK